MGLFVEKCTISPAISLLNSEVRVVADAAQVSLFVKP